MKRRQQKSDRNSGK